MYKTVWELEGKMPTSDKLSDLTGNEVRQSLVGGERSSSDKHAEEFFKRAAFAAPAENS